MPVSIILNLDARRGDLDRLEDKRQAYREAVERARKHLEVNPDDARARQLGASALLFLGGRDLAFEWARKAAKIDPDDSHMLYNLACFYTQAGDIEEGLSLLERAVSTGYKGREWIECDSDLDPIRDHPRYKAIIQQLSDD